MKLFLRITAFWTAVMMLFPALRKAQEKPAECKHEYTLEITAVPDVCTDYYENEATYTVGIEGVKKCTLCGATEQLDEKLSSVKESVSRGDTTLTVKSGEYTAEVDITVHPKYRISFVGDSITDGYGLGTKAEYKFTSYVSKALKKGAKISNFGVSGISSTGFGGIWDDPEYKYLKQEVYGKCIASDPEILFIMLGTNDSTNWDKASPVFESDYRELIAAFVKDLPDTVIVLVTPPIAEETNLFGMKDKVIKDPIIPVIKQTAADNGLRVFDIHEVLENREGGTEGIYLDGIHLSVEGAKVFAEYFLEEISEITAEIESK